MKDVLGLKRVLSRSKQDKTIEQQSEGSAGSDGRRESFPRFLFASPASSDQAKDRRGSGTATGMSDASTSGTMTNGAKSYAGLHKSDQDPAFLPAFRRESLAEELKMSPGMA